MHLFPTVLVYLAFFPAVLVLSSDPLSQPVFGLWDILGTVGAVAAVTIELAADRQLRGYRKSSDYQRGGIFRQGLWKYSRHPNYFGEVLFWLSMIPFAVAGGMLARFPALVFIGPLMMGCFFRLSCRLMDLRSLKRRPGYQEVIEEVSALIPWWPRTRHGEASDSYDQATPR
jgi:steroid 5-alpha reductase family enzyme